MLIRGLLFAPAMKEAGLFVPDCATCEANPNLKKAFGCTAPSQSGPWGAAFRWNIGGEISDRCPNAGQYDDWVQAAFRLYAGWKKGLTPTGQPPAKCPKPYVDIMLYIDATVDEVKQWVIDNARDKGLNNG